MDQATASDAATGTPVPARPHHPFGPPRVPNVGRIYDWLLGGKDNYQEDRDAGARLAAAIPDVRAGARENREFLGRAVRFLAGQGIRQFIDIGPGLPTMGSTHQIVRQVAPAARVVYADIDPVVISHARNLLGGMTGVRAILGDIRDPAAILSHPDLRGHIDPGEPIGVLLVALLHFVPDADDPYRAVSHLKAAMAPGSYLVLSHGTSDNLDPDTAARLRDVYEGATAPAAPRTAADIAQFLDGLEVTGPGLCDVACWQAERRPASRVLFLGGAGKKP